MDLDKIFKYVETNKDAFIQHLKEWISIKSISAYPERRKDCWDMVDKVAKDFELVGSEVKVVDNPANKSSSNDSATKYPPIIFATYGKDSKKKTVCIYGHIDVQPADKADGWKTEPFEMNNDGVKMIGRGTSDDKGPVCAWLCLLKAMTTLAIKPDVNMKFIFECMEESGSDGLEEIIKAEKDGFLKDVDYICVTDNTWLGSKKPCITYGLRGIHYYYLEVSGPSVDLHSGSYGGTIHEPMTDLIAIMNKLVDNKGKILIPGIYDKVAPKTKEEVALYEKIDFDPVEYAKEINCTTDHLLYKNKVDLLMHRWRYPSLSLHGIEGAFSQEGSKTVIPAKVVGKFSIRMVPHMVVKEVHSQVDAHVKNIVKELGTPNNIKLVLTHGAPAWMTDVKGKNFMSAVKATKRVYGVEPDLTREGGSIPITLTFEQVTGKSVLLLPVGQGNDGAHSQNEKLNISNYINSIKVFASYISELSLS